MNDHEPKAVKVDECERCAGTGKFRAWDASHFPREVRGNMSIYIACPHCLGTGVQP